VLLKCLYVLVVPFNGWKVATMWEVK
jgi:hypothetical protein